MKNKHILLIGVAAAAPVALHGQQQPNFVIILLDDMGYGDLTVTGAIGYRTPNIDRLCAEGMRLTSFYAPQPISSASRAGLMTGCYPNRVGFYAALNPGSKMGLSPEEETIATVLKKKDYATAAIGKWHLGDQPEFLPLNHGFDEYFGLPYSNDMWPLHPRWKFPPLPLIEGSEVINPDVQPEDQKLLTTQYTERAVKFIKENAGGPFFLYLAHSMPHVPLYTSERFEGASEQGAYGDVMMELDWSVGEVMRALSEAGVDDNTLVIFTSDNGPWLDYGDHAGSTGGLREGKGVTFEGGLRVPCIVRWPGKVPAGTINNQLASAIDLLSTIAELSGAPLPEKKIDGVSLSEVFAGDFDAAPRQYFLYYYHKNDLEAIRNKDFKLVFEHIGRTYSKFPPGNGGEPGKSIESFPYPAALYDMRRDPGERYDVQDIYPEVMKELMHAADQARQDLGDDLQKIPGKNRRQIGLAD